MTVEDTLKKADAAIDVIIKFDEQNSECSFKEVLSEILNKWRDLK